MNKFRSGVLFLAALLLFQAGIPSSAAAPDTQTEITARVGAAAPSYYLTLPGSIALGSLDATKDDVQNYEIGVTVEHAGDLKLKITSDREIIYKNASDSTRQLTGYNSFGTQYFTENGTAKGTLTVYKEDIARAPKGAYTGTVNFYAGFVDQQDQAAGDSKQEEANSSGNISKNEDTSAVTRTVRAHVLAEQNGKIKSTGEESMCWPFFYQNADLRLESDGQVEVTLYMIDPIPGTAFSQYGTPLEHFYATGRKSDIQVENFDANPGDANAKVTLAPGNGSYGVELTIDSDHKETKSFVKDKSGGIFVPADGEYSSVPVRFKLPLTAVKNSADGSILLTAYVKPMMVWKQFFLVLDQVADLGGNTDPGPNPADTPDSDKKDPSDVPEDPVPGDGEDNTDTGQKDGNYTAKVSMRKGDNINSLSMCAPLFYSRADLKVDGDQTTVTLYVINPIPQYASEGTPLSSVKAIANGTTYSARVSGSKVSRYFAASAQFIPRAGNYQASPITFTVPTSAVEKSGEGKLKLSAYVNAVMKSTQEFYVVFSDWEGGKTEASGEAETLDETAAAANTVQNSVSGTGISTAATTSGKLEDGEYQIPVTSVKEKTDEASMMADYLYPKASVKVSEGTITLTVYIQHTVAGIDGGGPAWISYDGTKAVKQENAVQFDGVSYDSFTFTLQEEIPSPMLVSMYINAMKMEVKARLVFDFAKKTTAEDQVLQEAEETADTEAMPGTVDGESGSGEGQTDAGYRLVTDAGLLGAVWILLTVLAGAGVVIVWRRNKRRMK